MDLFKAIDFYCERTDPSYWAEPINAISNISFILAGAYFLFIDKEEIKRECGCKWTKFFAWLSIIVGIGSYLFHTHANQWSLIADVGPITVFIGTFLYFTFKEIIKTSTAISMAVSILFVVIGILLEGWSVPWLNGSQSYLHAVLLLLGISSYLKIIKHPASNLYLAATGTFLVSITFRTIDNTICHLNPLGTHFIWHTLNGVLLFILIKCTKIKTSLSECSYTTSAK